MHRPSVRLLFAFTVSVLFVTAPPAEAASTITGKIVDQDGRPVQAASVLVSGGGVPLTAGTTSEEGLFSIAAPDRARLVIRVAKEGFRAEPLTVDVSGPSHDVGTITMTLSALSESVVVSASQVEVPLTQVTSSVTILTGAELEARQVHTAADALRAVPGLTVVSTGGLGANTAVFPRGGESNYTLVLVDGVPANAFGGDYDFGQLSAASVERIEIVRGPQSALYGSNAVGAVVRIVTRKGGPPSGGVMVEGGGYGTSRASASTAGRVGVFEWGALFDQLLSDGRNGETTAAAESIVNDDYTRRTAGLSAGWRNGTSWVRGDFRYSTDERGIPGPFGSDPGGTYSGIDTISRGANDRTIGALSTSFPLSSRARIQAQGAFSRIESDFASSFQDSQSSSRRVTGRSQIDLNLGGGLDASAGFEALGERARSTFITGASAQEIPIERSVVGYFGEARWSARDRLFLTAGLRVEDIRRDRIEEAPSPFSPRPELPADTIVSANPRVSAAWLARGSGSDYTRVRGAVGTGIRPPDSFELAFTDNPELAPERSLSAEVGVDRAFAAGHALAEATAFFNEYDDLIVAVGSFRGSSQYRTDNISNARANGLELALTLRGRVQGRRAVDLAGRIGYTLLDTEVLAVDSSNAAPPPFEVGQPLLRRPKHQFFADAAVTVSRFSAFVRGGSRGRTLDVDPSFGTFGGLFDAPGYQVWDAGASFRIGRVVEIFGRLENMFDRSYEEALGFPALGRRATGGIRVAAGR
jgi:outer membrane cobalamin receptor